MGLQHEIQQSRNPNTFSPTSVELNRDAQCPAVETIPIRAQLDHPSAHHVVPQDTGSANHRDHSTATGMTDPQWLEAPANEWLNRQHLEEDYRMHKRRSTRMPSPVAQQAVSGMDISRFVQPTNSPSRIPAQETIRESLFPTGPPQEDLSYSLRNFLAVNPVCDSGVVYARIAVGEGRTQAGYVPSIPQPRRMVTESEAVECSETGDF